MATSAKAEPMRACPIDHQAMVTPT
jgi:hypothetical protein